MNSIAFFSKNCRSIKTKVCLGILIVIVSLPVSGQNFTSISWDTVKHQPKGTHEVHGEVVNGKLYIFGGFDINKKPEWTPTKRSYVYDPVANTWTRIADLPHTPNGPGFGGITHVGLTNDGTNIYFAGGYTSNSDGTGQVFGTKQAWRYNVSTNTYTRLPDLPEALGAGQMRYLNGKIHYVGGADLSRADVAVHYALDLNDLSAGWKALAPLLDPVNHPGSAVCQGKLYVVGGAHHQDASTVTQKTLEVYDESTNTWTRLADMPVGRDHISSAVVVVGDRIIVLGGETSHNALSSLVSAYSPATNTWEALTRLPAGKSAGVAAVLNGSLYYTGGNFSNINHKGIPITALLPVADAFVRNGSFSSTNYGKDTTLVVKGSTGTNYVRVSYLKFSLKSINSVSSARLRIYGRNLEDTSSVNISSFGIDNDSWTESGITFSNAPTASSAALSVVRVNDQLKYYELDVTDYVKTQFAGDKIVTLLIKDATNQNRNVVFKSRENQNNTPQLVISFFANRSAIDPSEMTKSEKEFLNTEENLVKPVIYPNPMQKSFNIKFPKKYEGTFSLQLIDQVGRNYNLGKIIALPGSTTTVNISNLSLPKGVYFLKMKSNAINDEIKVIIE